jgi:hypothetical protein
LGRYSEIAFIYINQVILMIKVVVIIGGRVVGKRENNGWKLFWPPSRLEANLFFNCRVN